MQNGYYVFFDNVNESEIKILDYYWLVDDQGEFFYTVDKIIKIFNLQGVGEIRKILTKTSMVGLNGLNSHCSRCLSAYYLCNRTIFKNKNITDTFSDICESCSSKIHDDYLIEKWIKIKKRIEGKSIIDKFIYLPYHLKIAIYGYLFYFHKSGPISFNWLNYRFVGTKFLDEQVFCQLVMEGVMYRIENERIFDVSDRVNRDINDRLRPILDEKNRDDYNAVLNASVNSGFICLYSFHDNFENLYEHLNFMEVNIRNQVFREYDIDGLKDFILDVLADRCIVLSLIKKRESKVDFSIDISLINLFKMMLLTYSLRQVYSIICYAFKDVASFIYSNDISEYAKPYLLKKFIKNKYNKLFLSEANVSSFDFHSGSFNTIFEKIICNYVFDGKIRDLNDICVNNIIRSFVNNVGVKRIGQDK